MLGIWVRVLGPEMVAGLATPSSTGCSWSFDVADLPEGSYELDARLLTWNGHAVRNTGSSESAWDTYMGSTGVSKSSGSSGSTSSIALEVSDYP